MALSPTVIIVALRTNLNSDPSSPPPRPFLPLLLYLPPPLLHFSFDFSIFCNLKVSECDITLRDQLTPDTGRIGSIVNKAL